MSDINESELIEEFIHTFYGYGNFHGQYWFVGMEEAGGKSLQEISRRLSAWLSRGKREHEDVAEFHREIGITDLFSEDPKIQPTWEKLIRIVLASEDKHPSIEQIKEYQRDRLGWFDGDTCLMELLPLPSPRTNSKWIYNQYSQLPYLIDRKTYRNAVVNFRIAYLKRCIEEHKPKFLLFYGTLYRRYWEEIIGEKFLTEDRGLYSTRDNTTHYFMIRHPVRSGRTDRYFDWVGRTISKSGE